jgi:hypothetical protein
MRGASRKLNGILASPEVMKLTGWTDLKRSGSGKDTRGGDEKALQTLISYNNADIMNLEPLMELAYDEMKSRVFAKEQK